MRDGRVFIPAYFLLMDYKMKYFLALLLLLSACSNKERNNFLQKTKQSVEKRNFENKLELVQSKRLSELGVENPVGFVGSQDELFINDRGTHEVKVIDKDSFKIKRTLTFNKGRGPGEIEQITDIDIAGNHLLINDSNSQKIVLYNKNGKYLKDIILYNITFDKIKLFTRDKLFVVSTVGDPQYSIADFEGNILYEKIININNSNPLCLTGSYFIDKEEIYFGGYSESILKKYQMTEEMSQVFSRAFIENNLSEGNYFSRKSKDQSLWSFLPEAIYSSFDIGKYRDLMIDVPAHNGDKKKKIVDFYNINNGDYMFSSNTLHNPSKVQADNTHIYIIEYKRGDDSGYFITKYNLRWTDYEG
jgi:hypothetical protein